MGELLLLRHGSTAWSDSGQHTGRRDVPLTLEGERQAALWAPSLHPKQFAQVLSSPLSRAARTAELAGLTVTAYDDDLQEWDYGALEGRTTEDVRAERPGWDIWVDGVGPMGESLHEVGARVDAVIARVAPDLDRGDVALVAHGHLLRVLAARWLDLAPTAGALLRLDAACLSVLGHERERRVVHKWGLRPTGS